MENVRAIYVNTFAEGARSSPPVELSETDFKMVVPNWKRAKTVIHVYLFGMQRRVVNGVAQRYLIGDVGAGKVMLPTDPEHLGHDSADPMDWTHRWVCGLVEDFDVKDAGNLTLLLNRAKGIETLQRLNAERVSKENNRATGVLRGVRRGAYVLNVGGYPALMPKSWYDWDETKEPDIGEEMQVQIMRSSRPEQILVSRRHLLTHPLGDTHQLLERGTIVRAKVRYFRDRIIVGEIYPGLEVSIDPMLLRMPPKPGDIMTVEILGQNKRGYYGRMSLGWQDGA
jgi:hypothetical protein